MRIVILILLFTGIFFHAVGSRRWSMPSNQRFLQQTAVRDLKSDDQFSRVAVEFLLLDGRVAGQVPSAEAREQAWAAIQKATPAGRLFDHLEVVPPRDQPAHVIISAVDNGFRMTGTVGDASLKQGLVASLGGGRMIRDEVRVGERVREPLWAARSGELVSRYFTKVPAGELELREREFVLRGRVKGEEVRDALMAEVRAFLPEEGNLVSELQILPDQPAALLALREGNKLRLTGRLPEPNDGAALAKALDLPSVQVENEIQANPSVEPPKWAAALPSFLLGYFRDGAGEVALNGNQLMLKGDRPASKGRHQLDSLLEPMRQAGCEVTDQVRLVPDLEPTFRARLDESTLHLDGQLPNDSTRDRILVAAKETGAANVEAQLNVNPAVKQAAWLDSLPGLLSALFTKRQRGELAIDGNAWRILGDVESPAARDALLADLSKLIPQGIKLDGSGLQLASASPPVPMPAPSPTPPPVPVPLPVADGPIGFRLNDGRITATGSLAMAERKAAIDRDLADLKPMTTDLSRLDVKAGSTEPSWGNVISSVTRDFFRGAERGELEWHRQSLRLKREFPSAYEKEKLLASIGKSLPADMKLVDQTVVVAPAPVPTKPSAPANAPGDNSPWLVVQFSPTERRMEGQLPTHTDRKTLRLALEPEIREIDVVDDIKISSKTGKALWVLPISQFLPKFGGLVPEGRLELRNGKLTLSGQTLDPRTRDSLLAELAAALPNDLVKVEDKMTVLQSGASAASSPTFAIYFNANSDWIRPEGRLEIDKAAALVATLPTGSTVLVKGFADSRGHATGNLKLSELRAHAVRDSLIQRGISKEQLELIGVGEMEARPGRSEDVWSKDRRVEITAVQK